MPRVERLTEAEKQRLADDYYRHQADPPLGYRRCQGCRKWVLTAPPEEEAYLHCPLCGKGLCVPCYQRCCGGNQLKPSQGRTAQVALRAAAQVAAAREHQAQREGENQSKGGKGEGGPPWPAQRQFHLGANERSQRYVGRHGPRSEALRP